MIFYSTPYRAAMHTTKTRPRTPIMVSCTVHVFRVSPTDSPRNFPTSQKPESLTWEDPSTGIDVEWEGSMLMVHALNTTATNVTIAIDGVEAFGFGFIRAPESTQNLVQHKVNLFC